MSEFRDSAPSAPAVFYRSYSRRKADGTRESYKEAIERTVNNLADIGGLTDEQRALCLEMGLEQHAFPSGRALWVAGTEWAKRPENFPGFYNCQSGFIDEVSMFGLLMELAMCGTGTGAVLEQEVVERLPKIVNGLRIDECIDNLGRGGGQEHTEISVDDYTGDVVVTVGDSRRGWVDAYQGLIEVAMGLVSGLSSRPRGDLSVVIDLSNVRQAGEPLKGFGGVANPVRLRATLERVAALLTKAKGRKLTPIECCLLIDEAASAVVAGNIRRSAGMRQFSEHDTEAAEAKLNLYKQDADGNWSVDPEREALRMANHTRTWHHKPNRQEILDAVTKQFHSGEGAIQYVPEAIARANADLLDTETTKKKFLNLYCNQGKEAATDYIVTLAKAKGEPVDEKIIYHRMHRYGLNPCASYESLLLTSDGYKQIGSLDGQTVEVVNAEGEVSVGKVWCSGIKRLSQITLSNSDKLRFTDDHVFMTEAGPKKIGEAKGLKLVPFLKAPDHDPEFICLGFIQGDGVLSDMANETKKGVAIYFGNKDGDVRDLFASQVGREIPENGNAAVYLQDFSDKLDSLGFKPVKTHDRELPSSYNSWNLQEKASFLCGLYTANGSVISPEKIGRVTLKATSKKLIEQVKVSLLNDFGIESYVTTNKPTTVKFSNGVYSCRESYDLNIQRFADRCAFFNAINFAIEYKTTRLASCLIEKAPYVRSVKSDKVEPVYDFSEPIIHWGVINGFVVHNCAEILLKDNLCNLAEIHLNTINPSDIETQKKAFYAGGLQVASLLQHHFTNERLQYSRENDPIVAVSFTGLFDFFVHALGVGWLDWMMKGRPTGKVYKDFTDKERFYLETWKKAAKQAVVDYCDKHGIRTPNRFTAVQPAGSKSLLTGASSGWHPPKAQRFIRRITFGKHDPLVAALRDYGYNVIPAQSARDDGGNLLDDIDDPRVHEVLVEIPTEVSWANLPGADRHDLNQLPIKAQWGLYMQVQRHYATHTTSATLEYREHEIETLANLIHEDIQNDGGYISVALLARFDANATFPRLPFEPIDKQTYDRMMASIKAYRSVLPEDVTILDLLRPYDRPDHILQPQDTACANAACLAKVDQEEAMGVPT